MRRRRVALMLVPLVAMIVAGTTIGVSGASGNTDSYGSQLGNLPINPQWLSNTLQRATTLTSVQNNTSPEAIARRDQAVAAWKAAQARWKQGKGSQPNPLAKPEYIVVWSAKQNVADVYGKEIGLLVTNATVNPEGLLEFLNPQFLPGLDGFQVIDGRKLNIDGTQNTDYGKVVNLVQLPLPWGVETEAHHMQYQWENGQPIIAGGLFNDTAFVLSPKDIPNLTLQNIIPPQAHLGGSIPDAFDAVGNGSFIGTWMGGPAANFGGSPGEVVSFTPDPAKGLVQASETPAGSIGGVLTGNANGVPEPCTLREGEPLGTCANPHGIQIRSGPQADGDRRLRRAARDRARPAEDGRPVRVPTHGPRLGHGRPDPSEADLGRPHAAGAAQPGQPRPRADRDHGGRQDVAERHLLQGWARIQRLLLGVDVRRRDLLHARRDEARTATPRVSGRRSGTTVSARSRPGRQQGAFTDEPGGCDGGSWLQVAPNNRVLFHSVIGRTPLSDNYFDQGAVKQIYDIDISKLITDGQKGSVICDLANGIHTAGYDLTGIQVFNQIAQGKQVADCPHLISSLIVPDVTSGGPHWAALDNQSIDQNGRPYRLAFSDYFVARSGVDGDHRLYVVDVSPTGRLSYDNTFRDENTGALGVNFNRRNWPGSPDAGFYKPHSELWVCPPDICPSTAQVSPRTVVAARTRHPARKKHRRR